MPYSMQPCQKCINNADAGNGNCAASCPAGALSTMLSASELTDSPLNRERTDALVFISFALAPFRVSYYACEH